MGLHVRSPTLWMIHMRKFVLILLIAAVGTVSTGCLSRPKPGVAIVSCNSAESSVEMASAPHPGRFQLRREGGTPEELPTATVDLEGGNDLGFARLPDQRIVAKAGGAEIELGPGSYYWTVAPESEMTGPRLHGYLAKRTGRAILIGTGVAVVTAFAVIGAAVVVFAIAIRNNNGRDAW